MKLSEQIRTAIGQSGQSVYHIALSVKIEEKSLRRFVQRRAGLSMASLDRLAEYFDLKVSKGDTIAEVE